MAKRAERGKAYFMISAVSQKYDIHPQTLRLYEREGLLKPSRTEGQYAPLLGRRSRAARDHPHADPRPGREPGRRGDHPQHASQDRTDAGRGEPVHGLREARNGARHRRLGAAPRHRAREVVANRSRAARAAACGDRRGRRRQAETKNEQLSQGTIRRFCTGPGTDPDPACRAPSQFNHLEIAGRQRAERRVQHAVVPARVVRAADVHVRAVVGDDQPVALHRAEDLLQLRPGSRDRFALAFSRSRAPIGSAPAVEPARCEAG